MIKKLAHKILDQFDVNRFQTLNWMEISRSALLYNYGLFQKLNPRFGVIPVLKSNAYGHGIKQCAKILNDINCDFFGG